MPAAAYALMSSRNFQIVEMLSVEVISMPAMFRGFACLLHECSVDLLLMYCIRAAGHL